MKPNFSQFDDLPDDAQVPIKIVAAVANEGVSTIWRKAKTDPNLMPIRRGNRCTRFRVGGVRAYLAGEASQ